MAQAESLEHTVFLKVTKTGWRSDWLSLAVAAENALTPI